MSVVGVYDESDERLLIFGNFNLFLESEQKTKQKKHQVGAAAHLTVWLKLTGQHDPECCRSRAHLWHFGGWGDLLAVSTVCALRLISGRPSWRGFGVLAQPFGFTLNLCQKTCWNQGKFLLIDSLFLVQNVEPSSFYLNFHTKTLVLRIPLLLSFFLKKFANFYKNMHIFIFLRACLPKLTDISWLSGKLKEKNK